MGRLARPLFGHCPPGQTTSERCRPTGPTDQRKDTKSLVDKGQTRPDSTIIMLTVIAVADRAD